MSDPIYDDDHVALNRILGRIHNNPLGDAAFPLLKRLAGPDQPLQVLDVGSGRGASSRWWAARGAFVTAVEPSAAMRDESAALAVAQGLATAIDHIPGGIEDVPPGRRYHVALVQDVLCYLPDPLAALQHVLERLLPGGILSVTDYHGQAEHPEVAAITDAWGIRPPRTFEAFRALLDGLPAEVLLHADTTRQYRLHWQGIAAALSSRKVEAMVAVGSDAVRRFDAQVQAIARAIQTGEFGHHWAILEARP